MGKFDGYLICSDVDGTFSQGGDTILKNSEAVKYFTDNGGKFTFATGRGIDYLENPEFAQNINAPACLYNGALVWDFATGKALREGNVDFTLEEFSDRVKDKKGIVRTDPYYYTKGKNPLKVVCVFANTADADEFKEWAQNQECFKSCYISKSWNAGVEFTHKDFTKGSAVSFIKEYMKDIHTTVGVGDYDNDFSLLSSCDIGVAVGNASAALKEIADFTVVPASEYAIADLIKKLEEKL